MSKVFISFHPKDAAVQRLLVHELEAAGLEPYWHASKVQGEPEWSLDSEQQLRESSSAVLVLSQNSKTSDYITYEWVSALLLGIPIALVLVKDVDIHPRLQSARIFDFRQGPDWQALTDYLLSLRDDVHDELAVAGETIPAAETYGAAPQLADSYPPIVQRAVDALDSLVGADRERAIANLQEMGHPAARDALVAALSHPSRDVMLGAGKALAKLNDPRAVPGLLQLLREDDYDTCWDAAWSLVQMSGEEAVPGLLEALRVPQMNTRKASAWALGEIGLPALDGLLDVLGDENEAVRLGASEALYRVGQPAIPRLISLLDSPDARVLESLTRVLAQFGEVAVPSLIETINDDRVEVRKAAGRILTTLGDNAVPALSQILRSGNDRLRKASEALLTRIDTPQARQALAAWQQEKAQG